MILYWKDSLGCIDNTKIELINNMSHCGYLYIYIYIYIIAELDYCQIIILSIYVPSTHAYTHVLRLSLDLPYETR